jgi:hypothetical protein
LVLDGSLDRSVDLALHSLTSASKEAIVALSCTYAEEVVYTVSLYACLAATIELPPNPFAAEKAASTVSFACVAYKAFTFAVPASTLSFACTWYARFALAVAARACSFAALARVVAFSDASSNLALAACDVVLLMVI